MDAGNVDMVRIAEFVVVVDTVVCIACNVGIFVRRLVRIAAAVAVGVVVAAAAGVVTFACCTALDMDSAQAAAAVVIVRAGDYITS